MVGTLCHFYGWRVSECLQLPIRTFFALYYEAAKIEAREFREHLFISAVPRHNQDYFDMLLSRYTRIIEPNAPKIPPKPPNPCVDAGSQEAKVFLMTQFNRMRRLYGG